MHPHPSMMDVLDIFRVALALIVLTMASRQDLRERMAEDYHWIIIGVAGLVYLSYLIISQSLPGEFLLLVLAMAILFADIFWERPEGQWVLSILIYGVALFLLGVVTIQFYGDARFWPFMTVPVLFFLFLLFYMFDIIKGGADAKCLIAIALLFPDYPMIFGLPLIAVPSSVAAVVLPFGLMVLFHAALFTVLSVFYNLQRNLRAGDWRFPQLFLGYKVSIPEAKAGQYWPMEKISNGKVVLTHSPQDDAQGIFEALTSFGRDEVWVTPKIPFLVPITLAMMFLVSMGNLMFFLL
ncbi:MAG: A24 family peptidase C-terminal domain-containing protein [Candidatus Methanomethylophilaceae archaeon]|nr:A24 family peptidase C-terminal domain-containing protein [Candidatus Methanomethylophilaceae archaeon]